MSTNTNHNNFQDRLDEILTKLENSVEASTVARINGRTVNNRKIHSDFKQAVLSAIKESQPELKEFGSGKETKDHRYLVIEDGTILFCADDKEQIQRYIQGKPAENIAVFQKKYVAESVLCLTEYEDGEKNTSTEVDTNDQA